MQGMGYATAEDASGVTVNQIETGHELFPKTSAAKALVARTIRDIEIEDDATVEAKKVVRRNQQLAAQKLAGPVTIGPSTANWIAGSSASSPDSPQVSVAEREGVMMLLGHDSTSSAVATLLGVASKVDISAVLARAGLAGLPHHMRLDSKVYQVGALCRL